MKAVFIAFDQAHLEMIQSILDHHNCRGFSLGKYSRERLCKR